MSHVTKLYVLIISTVSCWMHIQNVPRQNVPGTKHTKGQNVPRTKRPKGQNVPRDKTSQRQSVPRDKTSQGTTRPKGANEAHYLTCVANCLIQNSQDKVMA